MNKPRRVLGQPLSIRLPHWAISFYSLAAIILLPWTIYLTIVLPTRSVSHNWDVAWGGFDIFIMLLLLGCAYLIARRSVWLIVCASALGTALVTDAWFDVLTARAGTARMHSLLLAVFIELPVALLSWYFVGQAIRQCLIRPVAEQSD